MENETNPSNCKMCGTECNRFHCITPLSKYLAMVLFIALPFIGGWLGYTYGLDTVVLIEQQQETNPSTAETSSKTISDLPELPICVYGESDDINYSPIVTDTSEWVSSTGTYDLYFKTIHPQWISIVRSDGNGPGEKFSIQDSVTGLSAQVTVIKLEQEAFKIGKFYAPITYEINSNTFWQYDSEVKYAKECTVGESTYTIYGYPVLFGSDEVSLNYYLILKPTATEYAAYDGNRPIGIQISYRTNATWEEGSATGVSDEKYQEFKAIIDTMVQNLQLMPVSKG